MWAWLSALDRRLDPWFRLGPPAADERGQGLIEYALLAAVVSIAAVGIVSAIGGNLPRLFAIPLNAL